jgi:pantoate--beta-alanine ligase
MVEQANPLSPVYSVVTMELVNTREELARLRRELAVAHHDEHFERPLIGLTPTMGALHAGHISLIERMCAECDVSIVSVFVNPMQFTPGEDYERYPQTLDADIQACRRAGAHIVFAPPVEEVYSEDFATRVSVSGLTTRWCGASRPGHFDGVTTVVAKLCIACAPDRVYFGEKDFQQLRIIQRMVADLDFNVEVVACPTMREEDGLALSSRNQYLSPTGRGVAPRLYAALQRMSACFTGGVQDVQSLRVEAERTLNTGGGPRIEVEYLAVVDPLQLEPRERAETGDRVLLAAHVGDTRLIDNSALTGEEVSD